MENRGCGNCLYYHPVTIDGQCRRFPPCARPIRSHDSEGGDLPFCFPLVRPSMCCGEWKSNEITAVDLLKAKANLKPQFTDG